MIKGLFRLVFRFCKFYWLYEMPDIRTISQVKRNEVIILANGPSIRDVDFGILSGKDIIIMNNAPLYLSNMKELNVVAYCYGEPSNVQSFSLKELNDVLEVLPINVDVWLNPSLKKFFVKDCKKRFFYPWPVIPYTLSRFISPSSPYIIEYQTTAQLALSAAFSYGYKRILLYGFDHDWLATPDYLRHFYSDAKDPNDALDTFSYLEVIERIAKMWKIYYSMKKAAIRNDVHILNKTPNSYLDVFDK